MSDFWEKLKKFKKNKFPICVAIIICIVWIIILALDIFNVPSLVGKKMPNINFELWIILASLTSGILTFLGVLWTIGNENNNRKEEEKNRVRPILGIAGDKSDAGFKYTHEFKINSQDPIKGKITVLNNSVCILKEIVVGDQNLKNEGGKYIAFSNENVVIIMFQRKKDEQCYFICEDVYGNEYKYNIEFKDNSAVSRISYIGTPTAYKKQ